MFSNYNFILASKSPRRQELLQLLDIDFTIQLKEVDEVYPNGLSDSQVATYLAELKASVFTDLNPNDIIITADTIVCIDNKILGKPIDAEDAVSMLSQLAEKQHTVITGVCLTSTAKKKSFHVGTDVTFSALTESQIRRYVEKYSPLDKAGAYGIQEWIGAIAIEKFDGCYNNVVGLPLNRLYKELVDFVQD